MLHTRLSRVRRDDGDDDDDDDDADDDDDDDDDDDNDDNDDLRAYGHVCGTTTTPQHLKPFSVLYFPSL